MKNDANGRDRALHRAADRVEQLIEGGQLWVAIAAGVGLVLLQIPGISDLLAKLGLETTPELRTVVVVILLASILFELRQLKRSVTPAISGRQHFPDPQEMYEALTEKAKAITDPEHREIKVLGLTLFSAWPVVSFFLERPEVKSWTVQLATLSKDAVGPREWIPGSWLEESATTVKQVLEFDANQRAEHDHKIKIFEYDFTPAVHGFRLGNGDVFIATLLWQPGGRLGKHRFSYDYIPAHDGSPGAAAMRGLFTNWFDRAVLSAAQEGDGGDKSDA